MNFYKLGMLEALEKFAIKLTGSDAPFVGMLDQPTQNSMNADVLKLYQQMSPAARARLHPEEMSQVKNLSANPQFANTSGAAQRQTRDLTGSSMVYTGPKGPAPKIPQHILDRAAAMHAANAAAPPMAPKPPPKAVLPPLPRKG